MSFGNEAIEQPSSNESLGWNGSANLVEVRPGRLWIPFVLLQAHDRPRRIHAAGLTELRNPFVTLCCDRFISGRDGRCRSNGWGRHRSGGECRDLWRDCSRLCGYSGGLLSAGLLCGKPRFEIGKVDPVQHNEIRKDAQHSAIQSAIEVALIRSTHFM